ncbi:hypothetical protein Q75_04590 [Bacillus coahuilensis p1.1.43]|uniref:DUF2268 domain-containing protein n=1 Tax=Bacillus coahuilensis p1.1.43 TaxID=1150625 RepID=A0A147K9Z6_9BACI|nr:DUF2268 domain-containing putative Zn-dependent protease [Bacillus coahuilensis]KUP07514.1 hypothetical protein Q75_04590 [Bacillus coahuilensis p1.1.43]
MAVRDTREWLKNDWQRPEKYLKQIVDREKAEKQIQFYLQNFGMYRPSQYSQEKIDQFLDEKYWEYVSLFERKYKAKWKGKSVPIYIFPYQSQVNGMGGVTFSDKLFLFLPLGLSKQKLEALFVHEYHHSVRLKNLNKKMEDFTLLDSIIMEGLAESAVEEYCGTKYVAEWCHKYSEKDLTRFWSKMIKPNKSVTREDTMHDRILFGKGFLPTMAGYAVGYKLIQRYLKEHPTVLTLDLLEVDSQEFFREVL